MEVTQLIALLEADGYIRYTDVHSSDTLIFEGEDDTAYIQGDTLILCANPNVPGTVSGMPCDGIYHSYRIADCTELSGKLILPEPYETRID